MPTREETEHKIPTVESGSKLDPKGMLAPGVYGYAIECERGLYIPWIAAESEGSGIVGKFLDELPRDRRVVFPTVLSDRLAGMLLRRGFIPSWEASEDGPVDILVRAAALAPPFPRLRVSEPGEPSHAH
jgi:hypothetical protein